MKNWYTKILSCRRFYQNRIPDVKDLKKPAKILSTPQRYQTLLVLALGKPRENFTIETMGPEDEVKYWRDDQGVHHVPKRSLNGIILNCHN